MNYNKGIFSGETNNKTKIKPFIITFAVFIIVLSAFSMFLFMYSLDFDINNLVESTTIPEETTTEAIKPVYSVETLSGNSNVMFIITDNDDNVEYVFCTVMSFDNKSFKVKQLAGDAQYLCGNEYKSINQIYKESAENGVAEFFLSKWDISAEKYAVFKLSDFKKFLSSYNGLSINIQDDVNYKSNDFNLELQKGKQELSAEKALNYLMICDDQNREQVLCDIISSVLQAEYIDNFEDLFKKFANSSRTDISVIDFYDSFETLKTYCYANDKFLPKPFTTGENV